MKTADNRLSDDARHSPGDVVARGKAIYERDIRSQIEIPENIGKVLVVDVDTGDYLMGDDLSADDDYEVALKAADLFRGHDRFGMRIGYNALDAAGGAIRKTYRVDGAA